jgi:hypothetical protein
MTKPASVALADDLPQDVLARYWAAQKRMHAAHAEVQAAHAELVSLCQHPYYIGVYNHVTDTLGSTNDRECSTTYRCALCAKQIHHSKSESRSKPATGGELDLFKIPYDKREKFIRQVMTEAPMDVAQLTALFARYVGERHG